MRPRRAPTGSRPSRARATWWGSTPASTAAVRTWRGERSDAGIVVAVVPCKGDALGGHLAGGDELAGWAASARRDELLRRQLADVEAEALHCRHDPPAHERPHVVPRKESVDGPRVDLGLRGDEAPLFLGQVQLAHDEHLAQARWFMSRDSAAISVTPLSPSGRGRVRGHDLRSAKPAAPAPPRFPAQNAGRLAPVTTGGAPRRRARPSAPRGRPGQASRDRGTGPLARHARAPGTGDRRAEASPPLGWPIRFGPRIAHRSRARDRPAPPRRRCNSRPT